MVIPIKEKIIEEIKKFPDKKIKEFYDIIISLKNKADVDNKGEKTQIPLGTMFAGKWQDERPAEEIIKDIKESRYTEEKSISL